MPTCSSSSSAKTVQIIQIPVRNWGSSAHYQLRDNLKVDLGLSLGATGGYAGRVGGTTRGKGCMGNCMTLSWLGEYFKGKQSPEICTAGQGKIPIKASTNLFLTNF